jgi:hypothetical protein
LYQFLCIFRTQMADRLGKLLDPYQSATSFVRFPSLDAPYPASLPSTHYRQQVHLLVWCDSPGEARTGPIFKHREIVYFIVFAYHCNRRPYRSIKTRSNDTKSNMKLLLELIYTGVRLGVMFSLSPTAALSISAILHYLCVRSFDNLFFCFFPRQPLRFKGVPSLPPAALPPPLSNSSPLLLSSPQSSMLPFRSPPPWRAGGCHNSHPGRIVDIVATSGLVPPPPSERATWAWVMGKEGGNVPPHRLLP